MKQAYLIIIFLLLSINIAKIAHAMDFIEFDEQSSNSKYLSVGNAKVLLANGLKKQVHLYDGCCVDCEKSSFCKVIILYICAGALGFACLVSAATTTGLAFPDGPPGGRWTRRPNFNQQLFDVGMGLWGAFIFTIVAPPIIIPLANAIKNYFIRARNTKLAILAKDLEKILDDELRLEEQYIYRMDFLLIKSDATTLQSLDADQAMVLALRHLPVFRKLVAKGAFSQEALLLATRLEQLLDMTEWDRRAHYYDEDMQNLIRTHRELFYALEKHLPMFAMLPSQVFPELHEQWDFAYNNIQGQIDNSAIIISDEEVIELESLENKDSTCDLILVHGKTEYKTNSKDLSEISVMMKTMIEDLQNNTDDPKIVSMDKYDEKYVKVLFKLSKLTKEKRSEIIITPTDFEFYLGLSKIFQINLIHKKCSEYCKTIGISGDWATQFKYTYDNDFEEIRIIIAQRLVQKINTFKIEEGDINGIDALSQQHGALLLKDINWDGMFASFKENPKNLVKCWDMAIIMKKPDFKNELIKHCRQRKNAQTVINAWTKDMPREIKRKALPNNVEPAALK